MLEIVKERKFLDAYQKKLTECLCGILNHSIQNVIGFPGGSRTETVHYSSDRDIWFVSSTDTESENRYWNAFGIEDPQKRGPLGIIVEINIPYSHDRRIGGVFLKDDSGQIYLGHRGKIGGGKEGINKRLFFEQYRGALIPVKDDNIISQIAVISGLLDKDLIENIKIFVGEVNRIKQQNNDLKEAAEEDNTTMEFTPETEYSNPYDINQIIKRDLQHAKVVNELSRLLNKNGYAVCNTRLYDLAVLGKSSRKTHIFEVKSDSDTTSIYTAIGQLYLHSLNEAEPLKILVAPDKLQPEIKEKLRKLSIEVVTYKNDGSGITFQGLNKVGFRI